MFKGKRPISLALMMVCFVLAALVGCGGGSDGGPSPGTTRSDSTVALFLADGPADDFDHIWIEVSTISLLPKGDGAPVVIYETDEPTRLDLLDMQEDDLLLAVNTQVPAGTYTKIRMEVDKIEGQQDDQMIPFHLESGKIDLNPRGPIDVAAGETLSVRLDIDADKSIHVSNGKYNFRPVIFVDVGPMLDPYRSHHLIRGEISELLYADKESKQVVGFLMTPFKGINDLEVHFKDNIVIFDDNGQASGPEALAEGQSVGINGELETDGRFWADIVVIGDVQIEYGEVQSAVKDNTFTLAPGLHWDDYEVPDSIMPGKEMLTVALSDGTVIQLDGEKAEAAQIIPGLKARVVGKLDEGTNTMNAVAVLLKAMQIGGKLTAIEKVDGGHMLTIEAHIGAPYDPPAGDDEPDPKGVQGCYTGEKIAVFLPDSAPIHVKGGSDTTIDALKAMLECKANPRVEVAVDNSVQVEGHIPASAMTVWPEMVKMIVESVDVENRIIKGHAGYITMRESETIQVTVPEGTPIWSHTDEEQAPITLEDIAQDDHLMVTGLHTACEPKSITAQTIVKMPGCVPDDDDPCRPKDETVKMTVAAIDKTDEVTGFITGEDGTKIVVTEETRFVERAEYALREPTEIGFGDIKVGDSLICTIVYWCDETSAEAVVVARVSGGDDPKPPPCEPYEVMKEVVAETVDVKNRIISTTEEEKILVSEDAKIYSEGKDGNVELTLGDIEKDNSLVIKAMQPCKEDANLVAYEIIKILDTE